MGRPGTLLIVGAWMMVGVAGLPSDSRADNWWRDWPAARFPAWQVQPDYPLLDSSGQVGSWCAGVAPNGIWAFSYGYVNSAYHCERVRRWILSHEGPVAVPTHAGFFSIEGWNRVSMKCDDWSWVQSGWGWKTVEAAFRRAQEAEAKSCHFTVNYW